VICPSGKIKLKLQEIFPALRSNCTSDHPAIDPPSGDEVGLGLIRGVQVLLKPEEGITDERHAAELRSGVIDGVILQLQQRAEFLLIKFADALLDVLPEHEIKKRPQFPIVPRENVSPVGLDPLRASDRRKRVGDVKWGCPLGSGAEAVHALGNCPVTVLSDRR
jgi:hypothetical protein